MRIAELEVVNGGDHHPRRWEDTPKTDFDRTMDRIIYTTARTAVDVVAPIVETITKHWNESKNLY